MASPDQGRRELHDSALDADAYEDRGIGAPAPRPARPAWWFRVAAFWRGQRWLVLGVLALVTCGIGFVGFVRGPDGPDDALYHALQLFALDFPDDHETSWLLNLARFAAPLIAAAAAVEAAYSLFREQMQLAGVRFLMRNHVVVVGLGSIGFRLAVSFNDAGYRVVVIERDPAHGSIQGCRERDIPVVKGDAADLTVLRRARVANARHVIVACGDDATNLDVALAASRLIPPGQDSPGLFVHLADLALRRRLQAEVLCIPDASGPQPEFFNVLDSAARVLLEEHPPFPDTGDVPVRPHLLFVGLDEIGPFVVLHAARRWQGVRATDEQMLQVTVLGPSAPDQVDRLLARYPELANICEIDAERVAVSHGRFQRGEPIAECAASRPVTAAYVCLADEPDALTAALVLRGFAETRYVPLVVTVWDQESGVANLIHETSGGLADVAQFAVLRHALVPDVTLLGMRELLARLRHEDHVRREQARGATPETNPSIVPWEELPESLRDSDRAFAEGIGRRLAALGCVVVPAPLANVAAASGPFSEETIEEHARIKHERWVADLVREGWTYRGGKLDPDRKLHPKLIPWERLPEAERERACEALRCLPALLARAGFEICRVAPPAQAGEADETPAPTLARV